MARRREEGQDVAPDGDEGREDIAVAAAGPKHRAVASRPEEAPGEEAGLDEEAGPDEEDLDQFSRWWDPLLDFFAERRLFTGALVVVLLAAVAVAAVLLLASGGEPRRAGKVTTTTTTTTTVMPTTTEPGPRPAQAATDTPVRPVVEVTGPCAKLVGEFRELFKKYPSGASVDAAGNDRLNELLGRIDAECDPNDAQALRTLELDVWLRYRPTKP